MAIDFPNSPSLNDTYTVDGRTYVWDGEKWTRVKSPVPNVVGSLGVTGDLSVSGGLSVVGENVTPYTGRRNLLYNGAMQVAQRGTSATGISSGTNQYYTTDRYAITVQDSGGTWTNSVVSDAPHGFGKSLKMTCTTAQASLGTSDAASISQRLEGQDLQGIAKGTSSAKEVTLSFWVKSNVTGTYVITLIDYDDIYGRSVSKQYTISSTDTWEYKTITYPADTTGGAFDDDNQLSLEMKMWLAAGSGYTSGTLNETWDLFDSVNLAVGQVNLASSVNNYWQITGVQLELGDKATPFEHRSYGEELALCERYFQLWRGYDHAQGANIIGYGNAYNSTSIYPQINFKRQMRDRPSAISGSYTYANDVTSAYVMTAVFIEQAGVDGMRVQAVVASGGVQYRGYGMTTSNNSTSFFSISAEL